MYGSRPSVRKRILASPDHSIAAWELWEQAGFKADDARNQANAAKEAYKDGLRLLDYSI